MSKHKKNLPDNDIEFSNHHLSNSNIVSNQDYYPKLSKIALLVRKTERQLLNILIYLGVKKSDEEKWFLSEQYYQRKKKILNRSANGRT